MLAVALGSMASENAAAARPAKLAAVMTSPEGMGATEGIRGVAGGCCAFAVGTPAAMASATSSSGSGWARDALPGRDLRMELNGGKWTSENCMGSGFSWGFQHKKSDRCAQTDTNGEQELPKLAEKPVRLPTLITDTLRATKTCKRVALLWPGVPGLACTASIQTRRVAVAGTLQMSGRHAL